MGMFHAKPLTRDQCRSGVLARSTQRSIAATKIKLTTDHTEHTEMEKKKGKGGECFTQSHQVTKKKREGRELNHEFARMGDGKRSESFDMICTIVRCIGLRRLASFLLVVVLGIGLVGCGSPYEEVANLDASGRGIICFGDSITRGMGATSGNDYPSRLSELLGMPVVNAGVTGDTTGRALRRLEEDALGGDPRVVIVALGGNDFLRKVRKAETLRNLEAIVEGCVSRGVIVVLLHAKLGLFSDPYFDGIEEIAERYGAFLITNVMKDIFGNPARMSDQIHPNDSGYALLAERVAAGVGPLLTAADVVQAGRDE